MMLMMPAIPAASNRADGLLMISIASMFAADTLSSPRWLPKPVRLDCRPSIRMATWSLPRSETRPSSSTVTPGRFFIASRIVPVDCVGPSSSLNTCVSMPASRIVSAVTVTSSL